MNLGTFFHQPLNIRPCFRHDLLVRNAGFGAALGFFQPGENLGFFLVRGLVKVNGDGAVSFGRHGAAVARKEIGRILQHINAHGQGK